MTAVPRKIRLIMLVSSFEPPCERWLFRLFPVGRARAALETFFAFVEKI
jgi:hypothetical protein